MKLPPFVPMYPCDGDSMATRTELFEAVLDALTEGIIVSDAEGHVAFWNRAAEAITGHAGSELVGQPVKSVLEALIVAGSQIPFAPTHAQPVLSLGSLVHARHRRGHVFQAVTKGLTLRDGLGARIGAGVIFRPLANSDALPHGKITGESPAEEDQTEFAGRVATLHDDFARGGAPLGVLWIMVDQSTELRKTHGTRACEAMLEKVQRVLCAGLMADEEVGRWGDAEFLVLLHVRNATMLASRAQELGGLARTTDFRWWGDRLSISVSIGAAQATKGEPLDRWLDRAQSAMSASVHAGGNHNTLAPGRKA